MLVNTALVTAGFDLGTIVRSKRRRTYSTCCNFLVFSLLKLTLGGGLHRLDVRGVLQMIVKVIELLRFFPNQAAGLEDESPERTLRVTTDEMHRL